jgi:endonuclease-8
MPEGDTIRFAANALAPLVGTSPLVTAPGARTAAIAARLAGRTVTRVESRGKHLLVGFDGGVVLHSHLRLTGRWDIHRPGERWRRPAHRAWLALATDPVEAVQFDGPVLELLTVAQASLHPALRHLGPDVLADGFDPAVAARRLRGDGTRPIGVALLDQSALAGIGNVWKCEVLHACRVDPFRPVSTIAEVLVETIAATASQRMRTHVAGGDRPRPVAVYGRAGRPCPRCGATIRSAPQEGRPTAWCPGCQT